MSTKVWRNASRPARPFRAIPLAPFVQFLKNITGIVTSGMVFKAPEPPKTIAGLRKVPPYWYPYTTMTKMRWIGRSLLEVVSTEFRDRTVEYYRYALESGVTTVNGGTAGPDTVLKNGDRIENIVHRHEPPVTSKPIKIIRHDVEREFIVVDKPGSIPVHGAGRYLRNTLVEMLQDEFGFEKVYPVNRLDRLTSGLMIIPLSSACARTLSAEFENRTVDKIYIARVRGRFPSQDILCEEPLLTVDRQLGLTIIHPEGKPAKTAFQLIRYDAATDSSVVRCLPLTGRSHQLRVHLQFLGHPIANDPVYSQQRIWGKDVGKGGIDLVPSDERAAPAPPEHLKHVLETGNPESSHKAGDGKSAQKLLPRETGEDIGMGSPVPLSSQAVDIITKLRNAKDETEDWSRWRDVIFRVKGALNPGIKILPPPSQNRRKRGGPAGFVKVEAQKPGAEQRTSESGGLDNSDESSEKLTGSTSPDAVHDVEHSTGTNTRQYTTDEVLDKIANMMPLPDLNAAVESDNLYCPECYLPLHPDPKPESLYIFLHAFKYKTSLGDFETDMPEWAAEDWTWDQS